jgi:hypothetical protein
MKNTKKKLTPTKKGWKPRQRPIMRSLRFFEKICGPIKKK